MAARRLEAAILAGRAVQWEDGENGNLENGPATSVRQLESITSTSPQDHIFSLRFLHDSSKIVVGTASDAIRVYDVASGQHVKDLRKHRYGGYPVTSIRLHPVSRQVAFASTCEGVVFHCDLARHQSGVVATEPKNEINCIDISEDGKHLVTAGKDGCVRVYDTKSHQLIMHYEGKRMAQAHDGDVLRHSMRAYSVKCHPENSHIVITGGWDNSLKVWDTRTHDGVRRTISGPHICGDAIDIKGYQILTGSWVARHALQIWDYSSGKLISSIPLSHVTGSRGEYLYCARYASKDVVLAGGSGANGVHAVNVATGENIAFLRLGKCVNTLDYSPAGSIFAYAGHMHDIHMAGIYDEKQAPAASCSNDEYHVNVEQDIC